jgi:hypothetical protein
LGEYSCRVELLNIVRKHSSSLGQLSNDDAEVDPQFWCELLDLFFVRGIADREEEKSDDDLVFFVRLQVSSARRNTFEILPRRTSFCFTFYLLGQHQELRQYIIEIAVLW